MPERAIDSVAVSVPLDPYLSLRALAAYSGVSVRKLRDYIDDSIYPLPCFRVGGKLLVRRSDFDAWIVRFRSVGRTDVAATVDEVLKGLGV